MPDNVNYQDLAADAVDGMRPNSKRTVHYYNIEHSPIRLLAEILKHPEVDTARLREHHFKRFSITIETK